MVDASSTTYVLDRMEARGWLERHDDQTDRRAWRVVLAPAGRRLHAQVAPLYAAALRETLRGLNATKVGPLTAALDDIQRSAHAAVDTVLARPRKTARSKPSP